MSATYLISPLGGPAHKLTDTETILGPQMSWSPDEKWLAVAEREGVKGSGISLIPIEQGDKRKLTSKPVALNGTGMGSSLGATLNPFS